MKKSVSGLHHLLYFRLQNVFVIQSAKMVNICSLLLCYCTHFPPVITLQYYYFGITNNVGLFFFKI